MTTGNSPKQVQYYLSNQLLIASHCPVTDYDALLLDCTIIRFNGLIDEIYQSGNLIGKWNQQYRYRLTLLYLLRVDVATRRNFTDEFSWIKSELWLLDTNTDQLSQFSCAATQNTCTKYAETESTSVRCFLQRKSLISRPGIRAMNLVTGIRNYPVVSQELAANLPHLSLERNHHGRVAEKN